MTFRFYLMQAALRAICCVTIAGVVYDGSAAKLNSKSPEASAPVLEWAELPDSNTGYAVEFSLDGFSTVLYSTWEGSGEPVTGKTFEVSPALWANFPEGTDVQWRVVTLTPSGTSAGTSSMGELVVQPGAAKKASGKPSPQSFSKKAKLDEAGPKQKQLREELVAEVPAGRMAEFLEKTKDIGFPVERKVSALGRTLVRLQTAPGADVADAVRNARSKFAGSLYGADGKIQRKPQAGDLILQPNYIYRASLTATDPYFASTPRYQYAPQQVHAPECWTDSYTGSGVIVAVIDTGLNVGLSLHQEFNGAGKVLPGPDYVNSDADPADDNGHGTNVAGIAVAEADATGMVGIAPEAKLMPIKVLNAGGSGATSDISLAVDYAVASGAKVINMSLGSSPFGFLPAVSDFDLLYESSLRNADDRGVVVVIAAGNDHCSLPASPASSSNAIYVAAVTQQDRLTEFSNYGSGVTVAAPGYSMYSTAHTGTGNYSYQSGTSQAAPVVAGVAALLLQKDPALTPRQVKDILQATTDDVGPTGRDDFYGFGRVNAARALGFTPSVVTPPVLDSIEITSNKIIATFTKNMLANGSANAVNNLSNLVFGGGGAELNTFLAGATMAYNSSTFQLTFNGSSVLVNGVNYSLGWKSNVLDAASNPIFCNDAFPAGARINICGASRPGTFAHQGYASAVASADGSMKVLFRFPITQASAQNSANYTLVSNPTNTGGPGGVPGGSGVSLAGASFSYDTASRMLTISNLPGGPMTTLGNTFALTLGSGIQNSDTNNPLSTATIEPIYGVVRTANSTAPVITGIDNSVLGNNLREVVRITFNEHMRQDEALFTPSNYALSVNGLPRANPSDLSIMYSAGKNEVLLAGYDLSGDNGLSLRVTVSNLKADDDSSVITGPSATSPIGAVNISGSDFGPEIMTVTANSNSLYIQFSYWTKMWAATVTNPANWILKSDGSNPPTTIVSLVGATFSYDSEQNALTISGLSLTPGNFYSIGTNGLVVGKRYATTFGLSSTAYVDVIGGNGDFSPAIPTATSVAAGGSNSAGFITNTSKSNVSVAVTTPASAVAGQKVHVTMLDNSATPKTASGVMTLPGPGAQTATVTGLNCSAFAAGPIKVQAMLTNSTGTGQSDIFRGTGTAEFVAPVSSGSVTDATLAGTTNIPINFTASDSESGVASTLLFVKIPGAGSFVNSGLAGIAGAAGTFNYTAATDGVYQFYTVTTDNAGNVEAAPGSPDATVTINLVANSIFSQTVATTNQALVFPMTNSLDMTVTVANATVGGIVTVLRTTPLSSPPAYFQHPEKLLNESLTITGSGMGAFTATLAWQFDAANTSGMGGSPIGHLYRFDSGAVPASTHPVTPSGNTITLTGITAFSTWYAGNSIAVPVALSDFSIE